MNAMFYGAVSTSSSINVRENKYRCNVSISLILLASSRHREKEHDNPRNTDFGPHFKVNGSKTRVEASPHEIIIEEVSRHADLSASQDSVQIGDQGDTKAVDH